MSLHIGKLIKEKLNEKGMSITKFAEKANMSYRNALYLFDRNDISVDQLIQISKVMEFDFMKELSVFKEDLLHADEASSVSSGVPTDFTTMTFSLTIGGKQKSFNKFPDLLKRTKQISEELGFILM